MKTQTMNRSLTRHWRGWSRCLLLAITMVSVFAGACHATSYVFTNIADSSGIFAPSTGVVSGIGNGFLSINNFGVVAFASGLDDGGRGVFKGSGGALTPIALTSGPVFSGLAGASINEAGTVAFLGGLDAGGSGVFTGNGGPTTPIALSSEPTFSSFGSAVINDAGTVAFVANVDFGGTGIFSRNGASTNTIALESGPIFSSIGFNISLNSTGTVAFRAILDSGGDGVFSGNGGPVTTIALDAFPTGITPSINDAGTVAYAADSTSTVATRILTGSGGPPSLFASNIGPFNAFGIHPVINNRGTMAFVASLDSGGEGLFIGTDPLAERVILTSEPLFGSTLASIIPGFDQSPGIIDLNDYGQIAFHYQLADGRQGIAVATPIPEPSLAALMLLGMGVLWRFKVRRANG